MSRWKPNFSTSDGGTDSSYNRDMIVSDEGSKDNKHEVIELSERPTEGTQSSNTLGDYRGFEGDGTSSYKEEVDDGKTEMAKIFDSEEIGATDTHIAGVFYDATIADKVVPLGEGEFEVVPDHRVRLMAAKEIAKMKGHYTNRAIEKKKRRTNKVFVLVQDGVR